MAYLLDSDTCIWVLREKDPVMSRVLDKSPVDLAMASMTLAELHWGARKSVDPKESRVRIDALLNVPIEVLPFGQDAARWHADLRYAVRSQPIGERDLIIASVAVANGLTLVTGNVREFSRVPDLKIENWTLP
jgi:tRNA(fMet)-specific endonuclease VapC